MLLRVLRLEYGETQSVVLVPLNSQYRIQNASILAGCIVF